MPPAISLHLVGGIEAIHLNETARQTKRHRCVIRPRARCKPKRPAAGHVGHGREGAARTEFDGRADGVAACESEQTAAISAECIHLSPTSASLRRQLRKHPRAVPK